jgi:hypothetical protein
MVDAFGAAGFNLPKALRERPWSWIRTKVRSKA